MMKRLGLLLFLLPACLWAQGTVTRMDIEGNRYFTSDTLTTKMRLRAGAPYDSALLSADADTLYALYLRHGIRVQAAFRVFGESDRTLLLQVTEDPATIPAHFTGSRHFTEDRLQSLYRERRSLAAVAAACRKEGFPACSLSVNYTKDTARVALFEGAQLTLAGVVFTGNTRFPADSLLLAADVRPGEPMSEVRGRAIMEAILGFYGDRGFPFCAVGMTARTPDSGRARLALAVTENGRYTVGKLLLHGLARTRPETVQRITGFTEGAPFSERALLRMRERLLKSGLFDRADMPRISRAPGRRTADVHVDLAEANVNSAEGILGYASDREGGLSALLNVELGNIAGTWRKLAIHYDREHPLTRAGFYYNEPWILSTRLEGEFRLDFQQDETQYTLLSTEVRFKLPMGDWLKAYTGFSRTAHSYRLVRANDTLPATDRVTATQLGITLDSRDFPDNPRRGLYLDLPVQAGFKTGPAGDFNEVRPRITVIAALPLRGRHLLYAGLSYATLLSADTALQTSELLPLGGSATLRGYRENQFYGKTVGFSRLEYRYLTGLRSRLSLFFDMGQFDRAPLFQNTRSLAQLLFGIGAGLSVETRAGSVSVDYGLGRRDTPLEGKIHLGLKNKF
ncbi:MAG: POTRA domain-containing protein [Fibrobacterota bacterium]